MLGIELTSLYRFLFNVATTMTPPFYRDWYWDLQEVQNLQSYKGSKWQSQDTNPNGVKFQGPCQEPECSCDPALSILPFLPLHFQSSTFCLLNMLSSLQLRSFPLHCQTIFHHHCFSLVQLLSSLAWIIAKLMISQSPVLSQSSLWYKTKEIINWFCSSALKPFSGSHCYQDSLVFMRFNRCPY